jgi:hypothetical protein
LVSEPDSSLEEDCCGGSGAGEGARRLQAIDGRVW